MGWRRPAPSAPTPATSPSSPYGRGGTLSAGDKTDGGGDDGDHLRRCDRPRHRRCRDHGERDHDVVPPGLAPAEARWAADAIRALNPGRGRSATTVIVGALEAAITDTEAVDYVSVTAARHHDDLAPNAVAKYGTITVSVCADHRRPHHPDPGVPQTSQVAPRRCGLGPPAPVHPDADDGTVGAARLAGSARRRLVNVLTDAIFTPPTRTDAVRPVPWLAAMAGIDISTVASDARRRRIVIGDAGLALPAARSRRSAPASRRR